MCTPSLAIDAIIEVHSSRLDTSTDALEREKDWPMSRKSCLAIRGHIPSEENDLNGRDTAHSAPNVRAAKIATLKDYSSAGKKRVLLPQDISIRNHVNEPSNTVRNRIHQESSYRLRHRGVQNSASSRTPAALNISQERVFSREQTSKRSGISIVLVFRRDPPSGFAIPGGEVTQTTSKTVFFREENVLYASCSDTIF